MSDSGYRCAIGKSLDNDKQRFCKSQRFLATIKSGAHSHFLNENGYKGGRHKLGGMPFITEKDNVKTWWHFGVPVWSIINRQPVYHHFYLPTWT